jgi:hypothetical protein
MTHELRNRGVDTGNEMNVIRGVPCTENFAPER